jgi:hypothetical protein
MEDDAVQGLLAFAWQCWQNERAVEMVDAYKWLFQAVHGAEHAVPDEVRARSWLEREWATLTPPQAGEPLLVPLRPDGQVVRLNLRPYRAAGGAPSLLLEAFLRGAARVQPDRAAFVVVWHALGAQVRGAAFGRLTGATWGELDREMVPQGYPAVHHSAAYRETHQPAYRVLPAAEAEQVMHALSQL